jgi:Fic family protein
MRQAVFKYFDLKLEKPPFDSPLTDLIIDLNHLRRKQISGTTPVRVFFQLKRIFHILESVGSARIEGNNTTLLEYIETKLEKQKLVPTGIKEIQNIEKAMDFIEDNIKKYPINRAFVSELHKIVVSNLPLPPDGEGDRTPGHYRKFNLKINKSKHLPPDFLKVEEYMAELFGFIEEDDSPKYDLLKTAIAHHRFVWIHPFGNGNGRTVRLFTYAMLIKLGFNVNVGRLINPTAIFCNNRNHYYKYLEKADTGTVKGMLAWCEYVLRGLKEEIEKIDKLLDYDYLAHQILLPTIKLSLEKKYITDLEAKILRKAVEKKSLQAIDIKDLFPGKHTSEISRQIKRLVDKKMLEKEDARHYGLSFGDSYLLRAIVTILGEKGFLPNLS